MRLALPRSPPPPRQHTPPEFRSIHLKLPMGRESTPGSAVDGSKHADFKMHVRRRMHTTERQPDSTMSDYPVRARSAADERTISCPCNSQKKVAHRWTEVVTDPDDMHPAIWV
jgi:hypothetical protein